MLKERQAISEYFLDSASFADGLFFDLSKETEEKLRDSIYTKIFAAGESVFSSGQSPCCIYFLREGKAQITYKGLKNARLVYPNEILGLTEAIADTPYEITVKTISPCRFDCIRREDLIDFLQKEPEICFKLLQVLGTNLQKLYRLFH